MLARLTRDPAATAASWKRARLSATHPDAATRVRLQVTDSLGAVLVDSGPSASTDLTLNLSAVTEATIRVVVELTPGSTPTVHDITVEGEATLAVPLMPPWGWSVLGALLVLSGALAARRFG